MSRVLVVEDDEQVRRIIERQLVKDGHEVRWAATVGAAIKLLDEEPFDYVTLDLNLGAGQDSGMQVARYKWTVARLRDIPIVLITAMSSEEVHRAATVNVLQGQKLILSKPLTRNSFEVLKAFMRG